MAYIQSYKFERCKRAIITVNGRLIAALKPWEEEFYRDFRNGLAADAHCHCRCILQKTHCATSFPCSFIIVSALKPTRKYLCELYADRIGDGLLILCRRYLYQHFCNLHPFWNCIDLAVMALKFKSGIHDCKA